MATGETAVKPDSKPSVKKAATPQAAVAKPVVKKAVAPKTAAKKAAASKTDAAAPPGTPSPQPALNPSGDWPFPTGLRP